MSVPVRVRCAKLGARRTGKENIATSLTYPSHTPQTPLEPILFPKLRIHFADFPYLHCSIKLEAIHLEDLLRLSVRPTAKATHSSRFSRSVTETPDCHKRSSSAHYQSASPINLIPRTAKNGHAEKKSLPRSCASVSRLAPVTAHTPQPVP